MITWRLDPPAGVRRQPATSSKRISARCTLTPVLVEAGALVDAADHAPAGALGGFSLARLIGDIMREELLGLRRRVPADARRVLLDQVGEGVVAPCGASACSTTPCLLAARPCGTRSNARCRAARVERLDRPRRKQGRVDLDIVVDADHEQPGPRLRHEQRGVDDQRAVAIARIGEGLADRLESPCRRARSTCRSTFSSAMIFGARPSAIRPFTMSQNG